MDIQEAREAFERRRANALNVSYEGLKANFDENSRLFGTRYNAGSINEKEWNLWLEAWQAKAQAVPEGFVLVKKELPEQIAEKMAIDRIDKPRHENDPVWREIAEQSYKDQVKSKKWEFWRDYKAMIEAQEPAK